MAINDNRTFMKLAIQKVKQGIKKGQTPFGACIVKNGEIISYCHNQVWQSTDITAHAEMLAIRTACKNLGTIDLAGCVIYSTCEPCAMCFSACHWANISKIVYGASIKHAKRFGFNEIEISNKDLKQLAGSAIEIISDFMRDECLGLFELWAKRRSRKAY